jgi:hypothetical protein
VLLGAEGSYDDRAGVIASVAFVFAASLAACFASFSPRGTLPFSRLCRLFAASCFYVLTRGLCEVVGVKQNQLGGHLRYG